MRKNYMVNASIKLIKSLKVKTSYLKVAVPILLVCSLNNHVQAQVNSCGVPNASTSGISVNAGSISNPGLAYDRTTGYQTGTSYAGFTLPTVGFGISQELTVGFSTTDIGDSVQVIGELPFSLSVSILSGSTIQAFNGANPVGAAQTINNLLSLFNLGSTGMFAIGFTPSTSAAFDRVIITLNAPVGVSLGGNALRIYDVSVLPTAPQYYATGCYTVASGLRVASPQGRNTADNGLNLTYYWYAAATGSTPLTTTTGSTSTNSTFASSAALGISANGTYTYYITTAKTNCTNDTSARTQITFNVGNPTTTITASCTSNTTRLLAAAPTGGTSTTFSYLWAASSGGNISANGTTNNPTITGNGTYTVTFTDANGCAGTKATNLTGYSSTCGTAIVLPATGLNLSVSLISGKPLLTWSTLQETNTSYFAVEASTDGSSFTSVGKVTAAGNSSSPSSYTFTDVTSAGSIIYYRIKLVDVDGNISYSNTFTLRLSGSSLAKIYPNPVTNLVNIETGSAGTYLAELFTVDGKKVKSIQISTASGLVTINIDRTNITSGIYMLKMTSKNNASSTYNTIMLK